MGIRCGLTDLSGLVEDGESVPGNENGRVAAASLAISRRILHISNRILWEGRELEQAVVRGDGENHGAFGRVVAQRSRGDVWTTKLAHAQQANV